jgi:F420-0:gamma-glutamyl ligase
MLLLPRDPDASAARIRKELEAASGARIGVLIIDSHGRAWRLGIVGTAIGFSGLPGLVDMRGQPDLFGYHLRITLIAAVDELAAAASLVMGQAAEGTPVVHVRGFPYPLREGSLKSARDQICFDKAMNIASHNQHKTQVEAIWQTRKKMRQLAFVLPFPFHLPGIEAYDQARWCQSWKSLVKPSRTVQTTGLGLFEWCL